MTLQTETAHSKSRRGEITSLWGLVTRVQDPDSQQSCETYRGLQTSYILQRIIKMSHGLELL